MAHPLYTSVWSDLRGVSFTQGWLDAGGIRTRFISSGDSSKPLLLLLHGVGGHAEAYARNFGPHAEHFWTVAIDLIGHGWTDKPDVQYQLPDYEHHVLAVLQALGRKSALISGESLGGWVSDLAGRAPPSCGREDGTEHGGRLDCASRSHGADQEAVQRGSIRSDLGAHSYSSRVFDVRQSDRH